MYSPKGHINRNELKKKEIKIAVYLNDNAVTVSLTGCQKKSVIIV